MLLCLLPLICSSVNLQTLGLLLMMTPLNLLNIYVYLTEETCRSNNNLPIYGKILGIPAGLSGYLYLFIAYKTLDKI